MWSPVYEIIFKNSFLPVCLPAERRMGMGSSLICSPLLKGSTSQEEWSVNEFNSCSPPSPAPSPAPQAMARHLATHWNYLDSFKIYCHLGSTSEHSDLICKGYHQSCKCSENPQVILMDSQDRDSQSHISGDNQCHLRSLLSLDREKKAKPPLLSFLEQAIQWQ